MGAKPRTEMIDSPMGHKTNKPRYGKGPSLDRKLKFLIRIALRPPRRL